jgi:hypothetical protein
MNTPYGRHLAAMLPPNTKAISDGYQLQYATGEPLIQPSCRRQDTTIRWSLEYGITPASRSSTRIHFHAG